MRKKDMMDFGYDDPFAKFGKMNNNYDEPSHSYDYDLFVIGGGAGGISVARWSAELGKKVALADFVKPSPLGTTWGLGGTCVNVGCIPKKLMRYAAILSEARIDQDLAGIPVDKDGEHNWEKMMFSINKHIKALNWGFKSELTKLKVKYFNSFATFIDPHTIHLDNGKTQERVTADKIVIAVGGRPQYPGIPGDKEFGITCDDLFSLKKAPGKTLVVGASYMALECAGFLNSMGYSSTVMTRSVLLRGFDQDMATRIGKFMETHGLKFIKEAQPLKLEKPDSAGKICVTYEQEGKELIEEFDTVIFAISRHSLTKDIGLDKIDIKPEENGKIKVNDDEQTNVSHIYCVGDVIYGKLELTPVAIKAGKILAHRLFGGSTEKMDYLNVPMTIYTPLEYAYCGLTEEDAKAKYGKENISTFHTEFRPLEWCFYKTRPDGDCYVKILVNKADKNKVVGFHILSPCASEVCQGIGISMKCGLTKELLDATIGIHPTIAEDAIGLKYTKEDNQDAKKTGC